MSSDPLKELHLSEFLAENFPEPTHGGNGKTHRKTLSSVLFVKINGAFTTKTYCAKKLGIELATFCKYYNDEYESSTEFWKDATARGAYKALQQGNVRITEKLMDNFLDMGSKGVDINAGGFQITISEVSGKVSELDYTEAINVVPEETLEVEGVGVSDESNEDR